MSSNARLSSDIFVVGSKPKAKFPDVWPSDIFTANTALARVQHMAGRPDITISAVILRYFFIANDKWRRSATAAALHGCQANRLLIAGGGPKKVQYDSAGARGLEVEHVETLSRSASLALKLRFASWGRLFSNLSDRTNDGKSLFQKIRITRTLPALGISTGLLALILALQSARDSTSTVYVIGIGIEDGEGTFDDKSNIGRYKHLAADKAMVKDLARSKFAKRIVFTDRAAAAYFESLRFPR